MAIFGIMNSINTMNNAAFRMMSTNNSLMSLTSFAGNYSNLNLLNQKEKTLMCNKLNSELEYKISDAQYESLKKLEKDKIKRSFSIFA